MDIGSKNILACVVTYNSNIVQLKNNILSYMQQVCKLVVVDNNSSNKSELADFFAEYPQMEVIYNDSNVGVAAALNKGLAVAIEGGYKYFLTMDDDSSLSAGAVKKLSEAIENGGFVAVGANYFNKDFKKRYVQADALITSGNLVCVVALKQIGGYFDELFIDGVDYDVCLKLREKGGRLAIVNDAKMTHSLGEQEARRVLCFNRRITQHTPFRYYYIGRNYKYLSKRFKRFRRFRFKQWWAGVKHNFILRYHDEPKEKFAELKRGRQDYKAILYASIKREDKYNG